MGDKNFVLPRIRKRCQVFDKLKMFYRRIIFKFSSTKFILGSERGRKGSSIFNQVLSFNKMSKHEKVGVRENMPFFFIPLS